MDHASTAGRLRREARTGGIVRVVAGALVLLACLLVVLRFHRDGSPAAATALQSRRLELIERIRTDLVASAEAEKSAVLATTDDESQAFADRARAASARLETEQAELGALFAEGTPGEKDAFGRFSTTHADVARIDDELLVLAVKNTNVKAYALAFGRSAAALDEMDEALDRIAPASGGSAGEGTIRLALGAEIAALRIQTLLAPHIAEESDQKMDALEARMAALDAKVQGDLAGLGSVPSVAKTSELATASARYGELRSIRAEIVRLSRENTNVRSLSISLNQKRKAMLACEDALDGLEAAIHAATLAAGPAGPPEKPR